MAGTTSTGIPYPTGTDRVADGDNAMQAMAEALDYGRRAAVKTQSVDVIGVTTVDANLPDLAHAVTAATTSVWLLILTLDTTPTGILQASVTVDGTPNASVLLASGGRGSRTRAWLLSGMAAGARTIGTRVKTLSGTADVYATHSQSILVQIR